ncbi:MAG: tetratricopeptide repeat protein, partial [Planctomycetota bacterium]
EKEFLTVLRIDKSFFLAYISLGDLYVVQGQNEKAARIFEELKKNIGDSPHEERLIRMLSERLAHIYQALQKPEQAIHELMIMKEENNTPFINVRIGDLYLQQNNYDEAAKSYQAAWDLVPEKLDPAYKLLTCYALAKNMEKQNELLTRLETLDTKTNRVNSIKAEIYFNDFEMEKALEEIDKAIAKSNKDPNAYMMKARVLKAQFRLEESLAMLDKAIEYCPPQGKATGIMQKLEIYKQLDNLDMAEKTAELLRELPLTPDVKASLGDLYVKMKRYQEATQYLREAIAAGMKTPLNFVNLGIALTELEKFEDIVALLSPAVDELHIKDHDLFRILGTAYISVKKYQRGVDLLQEALRSWGPNPWVKFQIAQAQFELKRYKETSNILESLETKFEIPQLFPMILHLRARLLLEDEETKDPKQAAILAQKAIEAMTAELFPDSPGGVPEFHLTWIKALRAAGNDKQADKVLEAALQKFPEDRALIKYKESGE